LENGQTLAGHLRADVTFFYALYSRMMYRCDAQRSHQNMSHLLFHYVIWNL